MYTLSADSLLYFSDVILLKSSDTLRLNNMISLVFSTSSEIMIFKILNFINDFLLLKLFGNELLLSV